MNDSHEPKEGSPGSGRRWLLLIHQIPPKPDYLRVKVRRRLIDATYVESEIPSRHTPSFAVDADVRLIPPNDLVDLDESASGFTVFGAGKTAMDTCNWLLDSGVDPDKIEWFRPRDPWLFNRAVMQPLDLVGAYMQMQACFVKAASEAESGAEFAHRLEADDVFVRIDQRVEPTMFRGATISTRELDALKTIERAVPGRRVLHLRSDRIVTDRGDVAAEPGRVYVNCTAAGVRPTLPRPVFEGDRMTLQYVTIGIVPWSAATVATVEARSDDDAEKNRFCPVVSFTGNVADGQTPVRTRREIEAIIEGWISSAYTIPAGPTRRPRRAASHPPPAAISATVDPSAIFSSSRISSVLCHWSRSGVSSKLRSKVENSARFPLSAVIGGGCSAEDTDADCSGGREQAAKEIAHAKTPSGFSIASRWAVALLLPRGRDLPTFMPREQRDALLSPLRCPCAGCCRAHPS